MTDTAITPGTASAELLAAEKLCLAGRFEEALAGLRAADPTLARTSLSALARRLAALGRPVEAVAAARRAAALDPDAPEGQTVLAEVLAEGQDPAEAVLICDRILARFPGHVPAEALRAWIEAAEGGSDKAGSLADDLLRRAPGQALALSALSMAALVSRQAERAAALALSAIEADPELPEARYCRAMAELALGREDGAVAEARALVAARPGTARALGVLGEAARRAGRLDEAERTLKAALDMAPRSAWLQYAMADTFFAQDQHGKALLCYRNARRLNPRRGWHHLGQAKVMARMGKAGQAEALTRQALAVDPGLVDAWVFLAHLLCQTDRPDEAEEAARQGLALRPESWRGHKTLGDVALARGRVDEAAACYERAVALDPNRAEAWHSLVHLTAPPDPDEALRRLSGLVEAPGAGLAERVLACFALGRVLDAAGRHDEAFASYAAGNRLRGRLPDQRFDIHALEAEVERLMTAHGADFFARAEGLGLGDARPIFIVGMPRSGSSLVEQILATHPGAYGAGESPALETAERRLTLSLRARRLGGPESPSAGDIRGMALAYLRDLGAEERAEERLIDKRLSNFFRLWLAALLFPRSRVIHCRRSPLDACLSAFLCHFTSGHGYKNDLTDLGRYYLQYRRLMDHWSRVLPLPILNVDYEELVADQEGVSRNILAFCGLPWDPACLSFEKTERPVRTASAGQVRQKLYDTSVGRFRRYDAHLAPLRQALGLDPDGRPRPCAPDPDMAPSRPDPA